MAVASFQFFCSNVLKEYFGDTLADFHIDVMSRLQNDWTDELIVMPRSHAKTTIVSKAYVAWQIARQDVHFIAIFSNTYPQAVSILSDIRRILKKNETFIALFGDLLAPADGVKDNDNEIVTTTGICVRVAGSGVETRGWTFGPYRPEIIIGDDIESRDNVTTPTQRDKLSNWWDADVQPMRDLHRSRIIIVGTICHPDSIIQRKRKLGSYRVFFRKALVSYPTRMDLWDQLSSIATEQGKEASEAFYSANREDMDEGAEVLWPSGMPLVALMTKRREVGSFAFATEYQNEPVAEGNRIVNPADIMNFHGVIRTEHGKSETWLVETDDDGEPTGTQVRLSDLSLVIAVDPAISQKDTADYFVALVMGIHPNGTRWVLDMVRDRLQVDQQVTTILTMYERWSRRASVVAIGIEAVAYQKALRQLLDKAGTKRGLSLPTRELKPTADKLIRLSRWQPTFERKEVHVQKHVHPILVEELTGFSRDGKTRPPNDDTVDGCIYGMDMTEGLVTASVAYESIWV